jgi:hypothetical protein
VNAPQSGAAMGNGMNKVSKHASLLLQTAFGFWGTMDVHFPQLYLTNARFEVAKVVLIKISVLQDMT